MNIDSDLRGTIERNGALAGGDAVSITGCSRQDGGSPAWNMLRSA